VQAPLLELDFTVPARLLGEALPDGVILTSANGAHAISGHPDLAQLTKLPVWTVGSRTTGAARKIGFGSPVFEALDAVALGARLSQEPPQRLLYLAAEQRSGDFSQLSPQHMVEIRVVYRALAKTEFPAEGAAALRAGRITDVMHYSRRLAETYAALAGGAGFIAEALRPRQLCLSEQVAEPLRRAGAGNVAVASSPREDDLLTLLGA
jgi:uroporphyrinogen-III synthase